MEEFLHLMNFADGQVFDFINIFNVLHKIRYPRHISFVKMWFAN